jgi:hypothetical protein
MNRSQTKIRKIQEANKIAEERFLMSEQASTAADNDVASKIAQPDPTKKPVNKKLPTDFNKSITFLFPDQTTVIVTPKKQDISKAIINKLGLGVAPQGNVFNLIKTNGAKKVCGTNAFNSQIYIFTEPNSLMDDVCKVDNINPEYLSKIGVFVVPNKPEFAKVGAWKSNSQTTPKE